MSWYNNPFGGYDGTGKKIPGDVYPTHSINPQNSWPELEPIITPEKVQQLHLFGIPLVSAMRDPNTGLNQVMPSTQIQEHIDYVIGEIELQTGMTLMSREFDKPVAFDPQEYKSYGFLQLPYRPISSLKEVSIKIANDIKLWTVPLTWISTSNLIYGQLNILTTGIIGVVTDNGNQQVVPDAAANQLLFQALFSGDSYWIPEFWRVKGVAGFPDGKMPKVINDLIGTMVAIEILGLLAPTYAQANSQSISVGGLSESISSMGPERFNARIKMLEDKKEKLIKKLRSIYQLSYFSTNV